MHGQRAEQKKILHSTWALGFPPPGFLHTGRGGSKPPGSPGWRPLPGSKAVGLQQPTGYTLFTIHTYLLPSPTQVGDAGRVRALAYRYRVGSVTVSRHSSPRPWFPPCIKSGGSGNQCIGTGSVASLSVVTDDKKSLADWRDFSVCVGITYLPGKSPCKYCRRR